jgi:hypothetical protein
MKYGGLIFCFAIAGIVMACGAVESMTRSLGINASVDSESNEPKSTSTEFGFDEQGNATTCNSLPEGYACLEYATAFTDACLNAGYQTKYCEGCSRLCSGNIVISTADQSGNKECSYYGKHYSPGQSFPSADGCNSCVCDGEAGVASCTEMGCANVLPFDGSVSEVRFEAASDEVVAKLTYRACSEKTFNLRIDESGCGKSLPWQCDGYIFFGEQSDNCTSEVAQEVRFTISDFNKRPANLYLRGPSGSCVPVLIGDHGGAPDLCL